MVGGPSPGSVGSQRSSAGSHCFYPALLAVVLDDDKPILSVGINGTWFLLTVSTESIAVLATVLLVRTGPNQAIELTALDAFVLGIVLYLIVMTLLFLRWTFRPVSPAELPAAFVDRGRCARHHRAGRLDAPGEPGSAPQDRTSRTLPQGMVLLAWATATFWLPVMVAMGIWRHGARRVPLSYHPSMWSMVFPIGMYGVATFRMIPVTGFTGLNVVPEVVLGITSVAWLLTAVGTVRSLTSR